MDPTNRTIGVSTVAVEPEDPAMDIGTIANTPATCLYEQDVYIASWTWLAVPLGSSVVLFVTGVAGVIWDCHIVGPNILDFASSLTRNNKDMDLPKDESTMGGVECVRMLRDVKVMTQDVKAGSEIGKIAPDTVSDTAQRLKLGRPYR